MKKINENAEVVNGKLTLKSVNKQDDGEYECSLSNGAQETIKLTVYGRSDDLNSIDLDDKELKVNNNDLSNELSEVDSTNESPDIALKRYKQYSSRF